MPAEETRPRALFRVIGSPPNGRPQPSAMLGPAPDAVVRGLACMPSVEIGFPSTLIGRAI